jgi:hypothetical protein
MEPTAIEPHCDPIDAHRITFALAWKIVTMATID